MSGYRGRRWSLEHNWLHWRSTVQNSGKVVIETNGPERERDTHIHTYYVHTHIYIYIYIYIEVYIYIYIYIYIHWLLAHMITSSIMFLEVEVGIISAGLTLAGRRICMIIEAINLHSCSVMKPNWQKLGIPGFIPKCNFFAAAKCICFLCFSWGHFKMDMSELSLHVVLPGAQGNLWEI